MTMELRPSALCGFDASRNFSSRLWPFAFSCFWCVVELRGGTSPQEVRVRTKTLPGQRLPERCENPVAYSIAYSLPNVPEKHPPAPPKSLRICSILRRLGNVQKSLQNS